MGTTSTDVVIIGAGPIGLELAVELKRAKVRYLHIEKGQIGQTISWFPHRMQFFSSIDRIAISGVPIPLVDRSKCTKEEYLAYLRGIVLQFELELRLYEEVTEVKKEQDGSFSVRTARTDGGHTISAQRVVFAIGDMHRPRSLGIPGEDLQHVSHYFTDPHPYFKRRVLVVGGKNSAVEAALRLYHTGAEVSVSYRKARFSEHSVKYWLLPEFLGRIERGDITGYLETVPAEITPTHVVLSASAGPVEIESDAVFLLTGYEADLGLLETAGVRLLPPGGCPEFDSATMETNVSGLYVAGTVTAGEQQSFSVFIENCHIHAQKIAAAITGTPMREVERRFALPES